MSSVPNDGGNQIQRHLRLDISSSAAYVLCSSYNNYIHASWSLCEIKIRKLYTKLRLVKLIFSTLARLCLHRIATAAYCADLF